MDEKTIEITEKAIRKNAKQETAFVDLLNKETKELSDSFDSYLLYHGYRKERETAREILQELESALMYYRDSDIACEFVFGIMDEIAKKHGVKPTEDKND